MITRILLALICLVAATAADAEPSQAHVDLAATRPNAAGGPDMITVRLGFLDISDIDDREQEFTADLFIEVEWDDPRLAEVGNTGPGLRSIPYDSIWNPRLTVLNNRGLATLLPETATVDRAGHVVVRQRLAGALSVDLDLREFPFDTQRLPVEILSYQYSPSEIVFSKDSELVAKLDELSGEGWSYAALDPQASVYRLREDRPGVPQLTFALTAERNASYYILTLALPMTLILCLAWMAHWLPVDVIPPRTGIASATVFSLIAFGVSFRLTLPRISYLTVADRFVLYSTLLVLLSLAITVTVVRLVSAERKDAAERLTRNTRVAFPFLYGLALVLVFAT